MTFEEFCAEVGEMVVRDDRPSVTASVEATYRASVIINTWESVDAVALFGQKAIERTDYSMDMGGDSTLCAGFIALLLPFPEDFARPNEPEDPDPLPLCVPWAAGTWFIMAIRDPHKALDGRNIIIHGDPNGRD
jgi:hypothetical protein